MGATSSNLPQKAPVPPKAVISIVPQAVNYEEGSCIKGVVNLNILQNINTSRIFLKISGSEKLEFVYAGKLLERQNNFLRDMIPICEFPDYVIHKGHYVIPFNLQLPKILPGSFSYEKAQIYYKIKAILPVDETHKVKCVQPIQILQKNRDPFVGMLSGTEMPFQVCSTRKQYIRSRILLDKPGYLLHEPLSFALEVKNETKKKIRKVQIRVIRELSYDLKGVNDKKAAMLSILDRPTEILANTEYLSQKAVRFSVPISKETSPDIPTTDGEFISCHYKLEVYKSGSWRKAPKLLAECSIRILPVLMSYPAAPKLPSTWNPIPLAPLVSDSSISTF